MFWRMSIVVFGAVISVAALADDADLPSPDCPHVVGPLEFTNLVELAVNGTLVGDDATEQLIGSAFSALGCLGEAVSVSDLGALYFTQGVNAFYLGQRQESQAALTRAYAIGGWGVLDDRYGDGVLAPFDSAAAQLLPKGVLNISFVEPPEEAYLNGSAVTSYGTRLISEMTYLLQWRDSSGWHNQLVDVVQGGEVIAGGGDGESSESEEDSPASLFVSSEISRRSPPSGSYSAGLVYSLGFAKFGHDTGALSGGAMAPGVVLSGDIVLADRFYFSSTVRLGAAAAIPDFSSGMDLLVGGTQEVQYFVWGAAVGPIFVPVTSLVDGAIIAAGDDVSFDRSWSPGVGLKGFIEYGDIVGELGFHWTVERKGMLGSLEYSLPKLEPVDAQPFARLAFESSSRDTGFISADSFVVFMVESGLIWSF